MDRFRERQNGLFSGKCLFKKSPRLATDLLLTRGAVVATPVAVAFSLTFSLVKNLKMLLQAKRQPGYKIPGRVDDRSILGHE